MGSTIRFSVCMSVYHGDNAEHFRLAVNSIIDQTLPPDEVVLVVDGPVNSNINEVIDDFCHRVIPFRVIRLDCNSGHAIARQMGVDNAQYEYIAIMDSDDIAVPDRFEKQMAYIEAHLEVDALGGQIDEFIGDSSNVVGTRMVPLSDAGIKTYLKSRCPMNLMTVMLKKSSVQKVGGFVDWYCEEDYYLWIRMALSGMIFANIDECIVKVRVGKEMYRRRGGMKYFKSEAGIQRLMLDNKIISWPRYAYNVFGRWCIQVAMPNWLRGFVFRTLFRKGS